MPEIFAPALLLFAPLGLGARSSLSGFFIPNDWGSVAGMSTRQIQVTVWNEFRHEKREEAVRKIYPDGIHAAIAMGLGAAGDLACRTATMDEPEHGLTEAVLRETDVLVWWGHAANGEVRDDVADRVRREVLAGMGLVVLHSAAGSKVFRGLMGTHCTFKWREAGERERIWTINPSHPIAEGMPESWVLREEEMYGEPFAVPPPDELVFLSWFPGGEVMRSGCCWQRGNGRVFYFRPGHESHPTYYDPNVVRVIGNACRWARRRVRIDASQSYNASPVES
jgi:trehalose utilization protein